MLRQIDPNDHEKLREYLDSRSEDISTEVILKVTEILHAVKKEKDAAIRRYTKQFDGCLLYTSSTDRCTGMYPP